MYLTEMKRSRKALSYGDGVIYNNDSRLNLDELLDVMENFTKAYDSHRHSHTALREAACYAAQYPATMLDVAVNDLLVGRFDVLPLGVSPQYLNGEFGYVMKRDWFEKAMADERNSKEQHQRLEKLYNYWENRDTMGKMRESIPPVMRQYMHFPNWYGGPVSFMTSFRIASIFLDYEKMLELGIPGLLDLARTAKKNPGADPEFLDGVIGSLNVLIDTSLWYADRLMQKSRQEKDDDRKSELLEMAKVCRRITYSKPESFREALQLSYLYTVLSGARQYGRMDDYLADFYHNDIKAGVLTEEKAIDLLTSLWHLIISREQITDDRIIIGGRGRKRPERADALALVLMETSRRVKDIVPHLTLRCYDGMNEELYDKALEVIGEGCTYPILYNDESVVDDVMKVLAVDEKTAEQWMPFGCGEYVINHRSVNSPNTLMNVANILWGTLNGGCEPESGHMLTPDRGSLTDYETFDDLFEAFSMTITDFMENAARIEARSYDMIAKEISSNLISAVFDDCMSRGLPLLSGGIRYKDGNCEMYGVITSADALFAIKKLIYDEKKISAKRMLEALKANFVGFEEERAMMVAVPKFGNGVKEADNMTRKVCEQYSLAALSHSGKFGLRRYATVNINNSGNSYLGVYTAATPDGRLKGAAMSNGNAPTPGNDKSGATALLQSMVRTRTDIHVGAVQNLKFEKEVFSNKRDTVIKPLLKTYFDEGGAQAMITVLGRDDLEAALERPHEYLNMIVRVGGLSARFVELDEAVQMDILNRTLY